MPVELGVSRIRSEEALGKVRGLVADAFNEHGATEIKEGSDEAQRCGGALQPVFTHTLMAGLIPPFSAFLLEILRHYRIHHSLHLRVSLRGFPWRRAIRGLLPPLLQSSDELARHHRLRLLPPGAQGVRRHHLHGGD